MTLNGWITDFAVSRAVAAVTVPLGRVHGAGVRTRAHWLDPALRPLERVIYRLTGVDERHEMRWTEYALAMLAFSVVSMLVLYALQRLQGLLPFNPQGLPGVVPAAALNGMGVFQALQECLRRVLRYLMKELNF